MAKSKKKEREIAAPNGAVELEYTTKSGVTVILTGMPPLVPQQIANSVEMPSVPTYEVPTADGGVEIWEHDETTLQTDDEKAAWAKYLAEKEEAETIVTERLLKAILLEAVEVKETGQLERWKKKQKLIGLDVPEDQDELLLYFKENEVYHDLQAIEFVMNQVLELTGVSREEIASMKDSFPDRLEPGTSGTGNEASKPEDQEG